MEITNSVSSNILSVHPMKLSSLWQTKLPLHPSSSFAILLRHDKGFLGKQRLRYHKKKVVQKFLNKESICRYGLPEKIITDNANAQNWNSARISLQAAEDIRSRNNGSIRRLLVCNVVQPGGPPPSEPPSNFLNWMVGLFVTLILPFLGYKWRLLLKTKNEVETTVQTIEEIAEAVENVADGVEKLAEDIADDLPEGGRIRKAVDFVENIAERASNDAHMVGEFIDKVQEAEEKVEESIESMAEEVAHQHHKEDQISAHELLKEENESSQRNKI